MSRISNQSKPRHPFPSDDSMEWWRTLVGGELATKVAFTEDELELLGIETKATLRKNRELGRGIPFIQSVPRGKVRYLIADIVAHLHEKRHVSESAKGGLNF